MSADQVLVADSWLVDQGRVLRLDAHRERFSASVARGGGDVLAAVEAFDGLVDSVPTEGRWFPRVDALADGRFGTRLRPAPERLETAVLWTSSDDPRRDPWTKGPDLVRLSDLRGRAADHGADEAVIVDQGVVVEGALSALVWWRDGCLHHVPDEVPKVASVTQRWLLDAAREHGVDVMAEGVSVEQLAGAEVWLLSALHGIRRVTGWVNGPRLTSDPTGQLLWQGRLEAARR